jgi:hypothetical protein
MKQLQIVLFVLANIIFLTQSARDVHQLIWGAEASILDQFEPEKTKARSEKSAEVLVDEYRAVNESVHELEKGKGSKAVQDIRQEHRELYEKKTALRQEIAQRESKRRELRDLWMFTTFGAVLIIVGGLLYRRRILWPGLSLVITGFTIFEYWASPTFFSGAGAEFHALLVSKTVLTLAALVALYLTWRAMGVTSKASFQP